METDKPQPAKWPFDPHQPGDHEPVPQQQDEQEDKKSPEDKKS